MLQIYIEVCKLLVCVSHSVIALYNVNCEIRKKKFIWKYFLSDKINKIYGLAIGHNRHWWLRGLWIPFSLS